MNSNKLLSVAMVVLSVDSPVDSAIVEMLKDAVGARFVKAVALEP